MTTVATKLAERALVLAEDPYPDYAAAVVELRELAAQDPELDVALLAALHLVGERGRAASAGLPNLQTGRAARLLVAVLDQA